MKNNYKTSKHGIKFITDFEGEILKVYADPVGLWTMGCGHLLTSAEKKTYKLGQRITKAESAEFLAADLAETENAVRNAVTVPITQNQFNALVSLAFNIGISGFKRSSVLRNLNNRKFAHAADSLLSWNKAGGRVLPGLTRRRKAERALFLTPDKENSISTPLPNARAASLIPATGNVETVGAPVNADTVSDDTDNNDAAHDAAPPNSTTQNADQITNVDTTGDAAKIEAAKTAPDVQADTHSNTGFLAKVGGVCAAIATGQYAIPAFIQSDSFLASLVKFFEAMFHGLFVLRYFVFGSIALWFVLRKVELFSTKIAAMRINSDPSLGNITLVAPPPKPPLFERIFGVKN